jgi:arsenite methyltransferase
MGEMSSVSPSLRLRQAALRLAAQEHTVLDLESVVDPVDLTTLSLDTLRNAHNVALLGAHSDKIARLVSSQMRSPGSLHIIESKQAYVEQIKVLPPTVNGIDWCIYQTGFEDLRTDSAFLTAQLAAQPIVSSVDFQALEETVERQRVEHPLVPTGGMDVVILDHVLNRVTAARIKETLAEAFRILRHGGHLVMLLLLADEPFSAELPVQLEDQEYWNLPQEKALLPVLSEVGYYAMTYSWRASLPVKVINGVELRTFVLQAYRGGEAQHVDRGHAVMYRGPWKEVQDEDGRSFVRGARTAVSAEIYQRVMASPYQQEIIGIPSYLEVPGEQAPLFNSQLHLRDPQVTKGTKTVFDEPSEEGDASSEGCCANGGCG